MVPNNGVILDSHQLPHDYEGLGNVDWIHLY